MKHRCLCAARGCFLLSACRSMRWYTHCERRRRKKHQIKMVLLISILLPPPCACRFLLPDGLRLANLDRSKLQLPVYSEHQEAEGSGIAQVW